MNSVAIKRILMIGILLLGIAASTLSCTSSPPFAVAKSDKSRLKVSDASHADLEELVADNTQFACNLYRQLGSDGGNLFFSPYSVSVALAMTYAGARGETEQQIAEALHFTLPQDRLHPAFNRLALELGSRGRDVEDFRLYMVNSLWGQKGYPFLSTFLDVQAQSYGAGLNLLDFVNQSEESRKVINDWVSQKTKEKIQDLLPPGSIDALTRLVLTNAIYFKADWKYPFPEDITKDGTFNLLDGSKVTVPMMYLPGSQYYPHGDGAEKPRVNYTQGAGYEAVELLYVGDEMSIVILLPEEGNYQQIESGLDSSTISGILNSLQKTDVAQITMPKFSYISDSISLKKALSDMGMPVAFSGEADLSGMDGTDSLFIDDVIHKTFISVNEAGTEAAGSTAVRVPSKYVEGRRLDLTIDRPFIYMIRDVETDTILFMGRVMNPAV